MTVVPFLLDMGKIILSSIFGENLVHLLDRTGNFFEGLKLLEIFEMFQTVNHDS